jgi:hypothetical protein
MPILNIYSKRKAALSRAVDDVYSYDNIPNVLRSQLKQMFKEGYDNSRETYNKWENIVFSRDLIEVVVKSLRREYGKDSLTMHCRDMLEELLSFVESCQTDEFLDCAEIYGRLVQNDEYLNDGKKNEAIFELNHRFREVALGYEFVDGKFVRIDSQMLHNEVLKPALIALSSDPIYRGAEQEILNAFEKYRSHDNKGAVAEALKAFESTMKSIHDKRAWAYNQNDGASKLIASCFANGLVPMYMQTQFSALISMLESGVPVVSNKTSGHGQGSTIKPLDDHYASYVLYSALANMKLLLDCEKALP